MSQAIVLDMNLSIEWTTFLQQAGYAAVHWSTIGNPSASDATIMAWAVANQSLVMTHDLDFGTALALTHASGPSVIQIRTQNVLPERIGSLVLTVLARYQAELLAGALVIVDEARSRVRVLPLNLNPQG